MKNLTFDQLAEKYPLCFACFVGIYAIGIPEDERFDPGMAAVLMQTTGVDMNAVEAELRGLTGAQIAEIIHLDPGETTEYAPLACAWLDRAFE